MSIIGLNKVWDVKELKKMPDSNKALDLLNRLIKSTEKLLIKYKWNVKILKEFYPNNQSLLGMNVNHGASILIRLRSPYDNKKFLEWHDILGTMCHELAHMSIGPHNADFYKLWDQLSDEVEKDGLSDFYHPNSGNSINNTFVPNGVKLGGSRITNQNIREVAANAALKRQKLLNNSSGSGQKLGGSLLGRSMNPNELKSMIKLAAERRFIDDKWCPTQRQEAIDNLAQNNLNKSSGNGSFWECSTCLERNQLDSYICSFCGLDKENSNNSYCKPCDENRETSNNSNNYKNNSYDNVSNKSSYDKPITKVKEKINIEIDKDRDLYNIGSWSCDLCTFNNNNTVNKCEICNNERSNRNNMIIDLTSK